MTSRVSAIYLAVISPHKLIPQTDFETIICSYGTDVPNLHGDHKRYLYGPGSYVPPLPIPIPIHS